MRGVHQNICWPIERAHSFQTKTFTCFSLNQFSTQPYIKQNDMRCGRILMMIKWWRNNFGNRNIPQWYSRNLPLLPNQVLRQKEGFNYQMIMCQHKAKEFYKPVKPEWAVSFIGNELSIVGKFHHFCGHAIVIGQARRNIFKANGAICQNLHALKATGAPF